MSKEIVEVKAFQVPCCEKIFKTMKGAKIHMSLCFSNIENRACKTCKTFESSLGCDHISCEGGYLEGITIHCSDWERK
jgi:hypothetical protein